MRKRVHGSVRDTYERQRRLQRHALLSVRNQKFSRLWLYFDANDCDLFLMQLGIYDEGLRKFLIYDLWKQRNSIKAAVHKAVLQQLLQEEPKKLFKEFCLYKPGNSQGCQSKILNVLRHKYNYYIDSCLSSDVCDHEKCGHATLCRDEVLIAVHTILIQENRAFEDRESMNRLSNSLLNFHEKYILSIKERYKSQ